MTDQRLAGQPAEQILLNEARLWVRKSVHDFFERNPDRMFTVVEVLGDLDERPDAPPGWSRWLDAVYYQMRYALVRNACQYWLARGLLETGTTINARGREGVVCYQRAPNVAWFIEVVGDDANEDKITESLLKWVRQNTKTVRGATSILLTRKPPKHASSISKRQRKTGSHS